ncbi:FAD:protein FMN transferase [Halosimplex amylolyticum]|uniref:FAD:protein FMN transferase n=1 Tax=Halosimplex amylolyticum TaxID=3396616 RepID=UPI003F562EA2
MGSLASIYERVGNADREFRCCDTAFFVQATGARADAAVTAARDTADSLESQLDAFESKSAVSKLNREGAVTNRHVARIARRGLDYFDRTDGVFDIHQGRVERDLKAFLRGDSDSLPRTFDTGTVHIDDDRVTTDVPLDLNGLAKGYIVDRAAESLDGVARCGFVSGGGDMSPPTGRVAIESPYGDDKPLKILDTDWHVATSGEYRRERGGTDHVYDPTAESLGSRHESVTVVARRDCMEADALATTLAALPLAEAQAFAEAWDGLEALVIHDGVFHTTSGFEAHVLDA